MPNSVLYLNKFRHKLCTYSPEPRAEVYCLRLNFDISDLVYSEGNESLNNYLFTQSEVFKSQTEPLP